MLASVMMLTMMVIVAGPASASHREDNGNHYGNVLQFALARDAGKHHGALVLVADQIVVVAVGRRAPVVPAEDAQWTTMRQGGGTRPA